MGGISSGVAHLTPDRHLTITFNSNELDCLNNLKSIQYVSNDPVSNDSMTQFTRLSKLDALTLDVTVIQPSPTQTLTLPTNLKHLKLSFRDDKDVHGNEPPHNMEIYTEDQIWYTIVLMSKLVEANSQTLEKLNLKLLLPINTLSDSKWPSLKELSVVRSFPTSNFVTFLANAPLLETLLIHGRPNNQYWIGHPPAHHKLLGSLKNITLAATPIQGDYLFAHLNNSLHSFTVEDQLSTRSAYLIVHSLSDIKLQVLRLEPLAITLDWLMTTADILPSLCELHCRYSRLRKLPSHTLSMFIHALAKFRLLRHLSLGWDLDDECGDSYNVVERDMTIKQSEFYHNLAFLSSINRREAGGGSLQSPASTTSTSTSTLRSTESPHSNTTDITTPVSEMSSPGFALSPHATTSSSVDNLRDDLRKQWNRRSNSRYWEFAECVGKRIPALETLNLTRYNVVGEREEITFTLAAGRIRAGRWSKEAAFPSTSKAFLL